MKIILKLLFAAIMIPAILADCSDPWYDHKFGVRPLEDFPQSGAIRSSTETRNREKLLVRIYLVSSGVLANPRGYSPELEGRTVRDVLPQALAWHDKVQAAKDERARLAAENLPVLKQLSSQVSVDLIALSPLLKVGNSIMSKDLVSMGIHSSRREQFDRLKFVYRISNHSDKAIGHVEGEASFFAKAVELPDKFGIMFNALLEPGETRELVIETPLPGAGDDSTQATTISAASIEQRVPDILLELLFHEGRRALTLSYQPVALTFVDGSILKAPHRLRQPEQNAGHAVRNVGP